MRFEPIIGQEEGNSGRSGAICTEILPFSVERERLTEWSIKFERLSSGITFLMAQSPH